LRHSVQLFKFSRRPTQTTIHQSRTLWLHSLLAGPGLHLDSRSLPQSILADPNRPSKQDILGRPFSCASTRTRPPLRIDGIVLGHDMTHPMDKTFPIHLASFREPGTLTTTNLPSHARPNTASQSNLALSSPSGTSSPSTLALLAPRRELQCLRLFAVAVPRSCQ
jgi:hypothetical protein